VIVVAGYIEVEPRDRDAFLQDRQESILRARTEPGCMEFTFAADSTDQGILRVFEIWASADELEAHLDRRDRSSSPASPVQVRGRELIRYEIASAGPLRS
jgi:quinol monooxygenase YgiN